MEKFKIKTNLILGNIYARNQHLLDLRQKNKKVLAKEGSTYFELIETTTDEGIKQELVEVPYPITPDYVKSSASSVDYKKNIEEAWGAPARGTNIGDAVDIQSLLQKDTEQARLLIQKLQTVVDNAIKSQDNAGVSSADSSLNNGGAENGK